jgi:hypothetical protein
MLWVWAVGRLIVSRFQQGSKVWRFSRKWEAGEFSVLGLRWGKTKKCLVRRGRRGRRVVSRKEVEWLVCHSHLEFFLVSKLCKVGGSGRAQEAFAGGSGWQVKLHSFEEGDGWSNHHGEAFQINPCPAASHVYHTQPLCALGPGCCLSMHSRMFYWLGLVVYSYWLHLNCSSRLRGQNLYII